MTGDDLKAWMAEHDLDGPRLAQRLGVHPVTVYRWRSGASPIPRYIELALAGLNGEHMARKA